MDLFLEWILIWRLEVETLSKIPLHTTEYRMQIMSSDHDSEDVINRRLIGLDEYRHRDFQSTEKSK